MSFLLRLGLTVLACLGLACDARVPATGELRDHGGRVIVLDTPPRRIVSLSPAITELLFDLGVGDRIVGRTRWGQDPAEALEIPSVGDGLNPNIEAVVAREPDLVLFYLSPSNSIAIDRLRSLGIATASLRLDGLEDLVGATGLVGEIVGAESQAESLVTRFAERLEAATVQTEDRLRVLILAWDNPPIAIGNASFLSEIVERAGGHNVFDDEDRPSLPVSIETIAARVPDVVLISGVNAPTFVDQPEWQVVAAIRERRFVFVEGTQYAHPSFRATDAIAALRRALESAR